MRWRSSCKKNHILEDGCKTKHIITRSHTRSDEKPRLTFLLLHPFFLFFILFVTLIYFGSNVNPTKKV
ncbi:unnamed protein product [Brassica oleracea]